MNKEQFLSAIREGISGLPQSDIERSVDYYGEMIDDHIEDGLTEEQAVEAMGGVDEVVSQILMDTPISRLMKAKVAPKRSLKVWEIVLLILGSPIWASLLLAAAAIFFSVYIVLWSVVLVLYAVDLSFAAAALCGIAGGIVTLFTGNFPQSALFIGAGLVCAGIAVLLFFAFNKATVGFVRISRRFARYVKSLFIGKGNVK